MTPFIYPAEKRILQIAHNHPSFSPGGTELLALSLHHEALRRGIDSWFLCAAEKLHIPPNPGTGMISITPDHREAAIFTHVFRRFEFSQFDAGGFLWEFQNYLAEIRPDIVHIHHLLNFGLESVFIIKEMLPDTKIYLTLHDYYAICANNGQLYKHETKERCNGPSVAACVKCFPDRTPNDFALRKLGFENALALCERVISPSFILKEKVENALNLQRPIEVVENCYFGPSRSITPHTARGAQFQFGYMGNISAIKGLPDLLDACDIIAQRGDIDFRLHVFGSQLFEDRALSDRIARSKEALGTNIAYHGRYEHADIPTLYSRFDCLVFPSIWWENAPLVIYEALYHQKRIVAYPHGGAAEILRRYDIGFLASASDPVALSEAMVKAAIS